MQDYGESRVGRPNTRNEVLADDDYGYIRPQPPKRYCFWCYKQLARVNRKETCYACTMLTIRDTGKIVSPKRKKRTLTP